MQFATPKFTSGKEVVEYAKKNGVIFYDFRFTDIKGMWHHVSYYVNSVDEETFKGIPFDGSSIARWQPINASDMQLHPEISTAFLDPFTADKTLVMFCDVWDIYKKQYYEKCPRSIAKKALAFMNKSGIADTAYFGPENEFFVFDSLRVRDEINCQYYELDSNEGIWNTHSEIPGTNNTGKINFNSGHRPGTKGGYFPVAPIDSQVDLRAEFVKTLEAIGMETFVVHHEVAQAQGEIGVKFGTLIEAADNVQKLKYIVKMVAHKHGKTATFMPKPLFGDNGNGMHVHISLWKGGKNLFAGDKYQGLSDFAFNYVGGVLKYARACAAFTNASTNSYKRLIPGFEAPSILAYSAQNRSASCRIPFVSGEKAKRVEFRFPDSTANPYLAFASLLMAGMAGVSEKIDPGPAREEDLFELSLDEIREKGIRQMPHTLREAMEEMLAQREIFKQGDVFTENFLQTYQHYKFETEIWPWEGRPHPYEFLTTYSC
ncbi:glutamine synthetase, type I [Leptospira wolbachii serovar Codice str. CDC]|uniref:Glutamine synthetase n=1 Tax=Leptospira wolbachii serovar Codice str. CDC TaxID=1218599 RepID=R9A2Z6_9LEPT|nr:type I glutamate--ammonia ligase [Leptospira wolbachii]EOQ96349.1 glutamine synthetase, type I [Leptospira wolbachii serovar Codice str. CDC]